MGPNGVWFFFRKYIGRKAMCNVCKTVQIAPKLKLLQTLGLLIELVSINHQGLMPLKDM